MKGIFLPECTEKSILRFKFKAKRYDYAYRVITHNRHLLHPYLLVDLLDVGLKNSNSEA